MSWGADAVIFVHGHTVGEVEPAGEAPVFYGLGNFLFDHRTPQAATGRVVRLRAGGDGILWASQVAGPTSSAPPPPWGNP